MSLKNRGFLAANEVDTLKTEFYSEHKIAVFTNGHSSKKILVIDLDKGYINSAFTLVNYLKSFFPLLWRGTALVVFSVGAP